MATPTIESCAVNAWTKVATNVTSCLVKKFSTEFSSQNGQLATFLHTSVATGASAPTDLSQAEVLAAMTLDFNSSAAADVYIYSKTAASTVKVTI